MVALVAAFTLAFGLAGCGGSSESDSDSSHSSPSASPTFSSSSSYSEEESDYSDSSSTSTLSSSGNYSPDWRDYADPNGFRCVDTFTITNWSVPPAEVTNLVNRIEDRYDLGLEFIEVLEDDGSWRYYYKDADGNALEQGLAYIAFDVVES